MSNIIQRFTKNDAGRDFVCGDIHGCFDELESALYKIEFNESCDRLFCVGDLIDRGPRSKDALMFFQQEWLHSVMGNHEHNFSKLFGMYGKQYSYYDINNKIIPGRSRVSQHWSLGISESLLQELEILINNLPYMIVIDATLILHAQLPKVTTLEQVEKHPDKYLHNIIWGRDGNPQTIKIEGIKRVYCGHTIVPEPTEQNGIINIDTGAFLKYWGLVGKLTVMEI